jgi:mono/diheme cytochrome c family protein
VVPQKAVGGGLAAATPGATPGAAPGQTPAPSAAAAAASTSDRVPNRENGARLYKSACVPCHGATGEGGHGGGPTLVGGLTVENIVSVTSAGRNNMPAFVTTLTATEIRDVAAFIREDLAKRP